MLTLQVISDISEFRALKGEWNNLAKEFRNPLYRHEWFDDCVTAYGYGTDLAVFVVRADGALRAIAPLILDRSQLITRLRALTHEMGETDNFIYADEPALAVVSAGVLRADSSLILAGLGADSKEVRALCKSSQKRGLLIVRPNTVATAWVPLDGDWKTIEAKMSGKNRKYIRWARRAAEREGPVRFDVVSLTEDNVDEHLGDAFRVEAAGWKGRAGSAILSDPRRKRFWTIFGRTAARLGILRLFSLRIGNETVAVRMAAEYAGRLWDWKIGYDERWSRCSPGILLTNETLRYACEQRLDGLEFLGQAERWQHRWPIKLRYHTTVRFYPLLINGGLALGHDTWCFIRRRVSQIFCAEKPTTWRPNDAAWEQN
jgi:CelD/BcsL family acetyltransferase involved in cellulose biosynthesis